MISCPKCKMVMESLPSDSLCSECGFELSLDPQQTSAKKTIAETLSGIDSSQSARHDKDNTIGDPSARTVAEMAKTVSGAPNDLGRTISDDDSNLDFSLDPINPASQPAPPLLGPISGTNANTIPDIRRPTTHPSMELGKTLSEEDGNVDFSFATPTPSGTHGSTPSDPISNSSSKTIDEERSATPDIPSNLGKTIADGDKNAEFSLGFPDHIPFLVPPITQSPASQNEKMTEPHGEANSSHPGNLNQTLAETDSNTDFTWTPPSRLPTNNSETLSPPPPAAKTVSDNTIVEKTKPSLTDFAIGSHSESKKTVPDRIEKPIADLSATIDVGSSDKTFVARPANPTVDGAAFSVDELDRQNREQKDRQPSQKPNIASARTMEDSSPSNANQKGGLGATVDASPLEHSQTLDFSADGLTAPISATIHVRSDNVTVGEVSISIPSGRTNQGGLTLPSTGDSVDSVDDEWLLKSISKRSLAPDGPITTGIVSPDYKIVKKLGEGGMGVVYCAIQKSLDRHVAVKAIKGGAAVSKDARRKFFYEARITGDLDHPNIVPIHEIGTQDDGTLFYSMKMVDGTPWQEVIKKRSKEENLETFMKVCDAVAFAHSRNVIHRDLKPENVMLGAFGEVLVMDWGLAIQLPPTRPFGMSGTPAYMSPEMARHDVSAIGKGSDVYILGGILYELITGHAPHTGGNVRECLINATRNEIVPTDIDDPLVDIARHAMASRVDDRYATVLEMQEAIREVLRHAESISLTKRAEDWLEMALHQSDYQGFSRALFSMQEAIDLWPENRTAIEGVTKAKFAYGKSALEKGDYDLCLQVMDPNIAEHAAQMHLARERKDANLQREARLKLTRRVLAGVVLSAAASLSVLAGYALWQAQIAKTEAARARIAEGEAKTSEKNATEERNKAESAEGVAKEEAAKAVAAGEKEKEAKDVAVKAKEEAETQKVLADKNARVAVSQSRIAILGSYQSKITLANSQSAQLETPQSSQSIRDVASLASAWPTSPDPKDSKLDPTPEAVRDMLSNWALRRIQYFNNEDLPRFTSPSPHVALDYDPVSGWLVAADADHQVRWLKPDEAEWKWDDRPVYRSEDSIRSLAIAPGGDKVILLSKDSADHSTALLLIPEKGIVSTVEGVDRKPLQQVVFTTDGKWLFGGINTGLWSWKVLEDGLSSPSVMTFRGTIESVHGLGGDKSNYVFGISRLPQSNVSCFVADLATERVALVQIPSLKNVKLSTASMTPDGNAIVLGYDDGNVVPIGVNWTKATDKNGNEQFKVDLSGNLEAGFDKYSPLKYHRNRVEEIRCFEDGSIMSRANETVIPIWNLNAQKELSQPNFLYGLDRAVKHFRFLKDGNTVIASDIAGTLMRWNRQEQVQRSGELLLHTPLVKDRAPVGIVAAAFDPKLKPFAVDDNGVLISRVATSAPDSGSGLAHDYIGHTPYSTIIGASKASTQPWVATLARLSKNSHAYLGSADQLMELCVWNLDTGRMVTRKTLPSGMNSRVTFLRGDKQIGITDGKAYWSISTDDWRINPPETRFGSVISTPHPVESNLVTLIANSGAVRLFDPSVASSWENEDLRNFDLAINNRSLPVQSAWSSDGKRLFVLFDNGALARLSWENSRLTDFQWSTPLLAGIDAESDTAWSYVDLDVHPGADAIDQIRIAKRTSETQRKTQLLSLRWPRSDLQPTIDRDESQSGDAYWVFHSDTPWNLKESPLVFAESDVSKVLPVVPNEWIAVEGNGTIHRLLRNANQQTDSRIANRTRCIAAIADASARRWLTLHRDNAVWFAQSNSINGLEWLPIQHPLTRATKIEMARDGKRFWILGQDGDGRNVACTYAASGDQEPWNLQAIESDVLHLAESPTSDDWFFLTPLGTIQRASWENGAFKRQEIPIADGPIQDSHGITQMAWFRQRATSESIQEWSLMLLSAIPEGSRIDWLPLNQEKSQFESGFQNSLNGQNMVMDTSPEGNIFVAGDDSGTLGTWFASPQLEKQARTLFNLPRHTGSRIRSVRFAGKATDNLDSLITADSSGRVFGWYTKEGKPTELLKPLLATDEESNERPIGKLIRQQ